MTTIDAGNRAAPKWRLTLFYVASVILSVGGFLAIANAGERWFSVAGRSAPASREAPLTGGAALNVHALPKVLLALAVIIVCSRVLGFLFAKIRQPRVIGEVIAGILLGPTFLGAIAPDVRAFVLPASASPFLEILAQIGVVLFMFLVGLELDPAHLRVKTHATIAISHASILTPFMLGSGAALYMYPRLSDPAVPFTTFALFLGVSLSVTAFPVLARILSERQLDKTQLGALTISCAAIDDVTAWCLLAGVVGVVNSEYEGLLTTLALTAVYVAVMFLVVRPVVRRFARLHGGRELRQGIVALVFVGLLMAAFTTEWIGIHALFGAFSFGACIPHDSPLARSLKSRIQDVAVVLLLPAFFAFTGMRTQIGLVEGFEDLTLCALIIVLATLGKFGGSYVAARVAGLSNQHSAAIGILMNTRGLMELVVLNVGLDMGVITPKVFAMLVIMAIVTTLATTPILTALRLESGFVNAAGEGGSRAR